MLEAGLRLAVAGLAGLAVGIEREWSGHASGPNARFGGVRTFMLLGLLGGLGGWLLSEGHDGAGAILLAGGLTLVVVAYLMAARRASDPEAIEATTEVAALLVISLGAAAGLGFPAIASGITAVVVLALREKHTIQGFITRIGELELRAAFQFAVLALVVLPILPAGPFGPFGGIRPRTIWTVVLVFSGLNYLGYLARRILGQRRGFGVAGALGGLVSSTAVTLTFARRSKVEPEHGAALGIGVLAACTVLVPRVFGIATALNSGLGLVLVRGLIPPMVLGIVVLWYVSRRQPGQAQEIDPPAIGNPLQLGSAIRMAIAFQVVMLALEFAATRYGQGGIYGSAAFLGLTDMDALTFSMSRLGEAAVPNVIAAQAIVLGIGSNTILKLALVLGLGSVKFRQVAGVGLATLAVATALGFWMLLG
jgi:uncharacterized membrane protein (DUF4010 family)